MNLLFGHLILNPKQGEQIKRTLVYRRNITSAQSEYVLLSCEIPTNNLLSAYKKTETTTTLSEFCWNNKDAADYYSILSVVLSSVNKCKLLKNGKAPKKSKIQVESRATANGNVLVYTGTVKSYTFTVMKSQIADVIYSVTISGSDGLELTLQTGLLKGNAEGEAKLHAIIDNMQFVNTNSVDKTKITDIGEIKSEEEDLMSRHVKTIEEIALTKDVTWLKNKKYYVIKDERTAEQIFRTLEQYEGLISYDVETTGLNMNMYCEIGSPLKKQLEDYNASVEKELRIKADSLTGFSFCVQPNIAYYFPCGHRKFKNLYSDKGEEITRNICNVIKNRYLFGDLKDDDSYIANYIRNTSYEEWTSDVVLMERVRDILEKHKILAHHGSFEYKVDLCYHIDTNLVEDTMILHQLAFKWKNVRTHAGEPSNLKYLTKTVLGCDQLSLEDFFSGFVEAETAGEVRTASMTAKKKSKKKKILIDFSYMDEEGTRCYAPADVDFTLQLWNIFKVDMNTQFKDLDYLYGVEIILACAIGYAEFYGLHINESKINNAKYESLVKMADMEHKVRSYNNLCDEEENKAFDDLMVLWENKDTSHDVLEIALTRLSEIVEKRGNLNLGSPGQVGQLLYTKYNWKTDEDGKMSMGKKVIKQYEKLTDEEGKPLYPEVIWYRQWKDESTLITKFFDKLQDFMYPGGNIFTSFGQIACATGRMSSKKPNFQQMPGSITKIIEPREGYVFFDGDFSQIEYRCLCALANERSLIEAFKDPDMDYHQKMASLMYDVPYALVPDALRKSAKTFNFGIPYGMGFASLAIQLHGNKNKSSVEDAKEKYELYFKEQPKVRQFFVDVKEAAQYNEYTKTYFGRRRYFKFTDETGNLNQSFVASALRQAGNAVIQGCLSGETRIETKEYGVVKIKDVAGISCLVWNGTDWTYGDISYSGKKQKCIITFDDDTELICSPIHKFLLVGKDPRDVSNYVECKDLTDKHFIECNISAKSSLTKFSKAVGLKVKSVEITDEYIDMYDVCNTECGYYVADGIITHNTARDIFGIAAARAFMNIRSNHLIGKVRMCNFIHDEVLYEISAKLNPISVVGMILESMQLNIPGFPPLYVGGGIGNAWKTAKGSMNEIHPTLGLQMIEEAHNNVMPEGLDGTAESIYKYFENRVYTFRKEKIAAYVASVEYLLRTNQTFDAIDPAIGKLLGLQFEGGVDEKVKQHIKEYKEHCALKGIEPDDKKLQAFKEQIVPLRLKTFIFDFADTVKAELIKIGAQITDDTDLNNLLFVQQLNNTIGNSYEEDEEQVAYDDGDEDEYDDLEDYEFELINESNELYGVSIIDIAKQFGLAIIPSKKVCCIYIGNKTQKQIEHLATLFDKHQCDEDDEGAMKVELVRADNYVLRPDIYVNNISSDMVQEELLVT